MRILVADDHELVRRGICSSLVSRPEIVICGEAFDGRDAVDKALSSQPDVVVMDISMPRMNGLEATREIKRLLPNTEVVIVSQHEAPEMMRQAFSAGARGYVVKSAISKDLLAALDKVSVREPFVASGTTTNSDLAVSSPRDLSNQKSPAASDARFRPAAEDIAEGLSAIDAHGLYRVIGESLDYGIWICDASGRNIYTSPSFLNLVGLTQEQCSDFAWANMLHPDEAESTMAAWRDCVRSGSPWEREHRYRTANGDWRYILARGGPIRDAQGKILYWAGINLDIQHRKESEVALEARIAERTDALQKAGDELLRLSATLLQTQDEERRRIARELHDGVGQLLAALSMNIPAIEREQNKLSPEARAALQRNVELVDQASQEIRTMSHLLHPPLLDEVGLESALQWYVDGFAERSKIAVTTDVTPDFSDGLPRELALAIFRIVQECLTNVHRHSSSPTVTIKIERTAQDISVEVRDQGKGMPAEVRSRITSGESPGVGLRGMRERTRQFNGRLDVSSAPGDTCIRAVFSLLQSAAPEAPRAEVKRSSESATVLCVDDEEAGLITRRLLLESAGHRVLDARSGPEALAIFQAEDVDAVILDYWMSGMKGTAVAAEMKRLKPSIPIIVLSGVSDLPGEGTGVVDQWLIKGTHRAEHLLDSVSTLLERNLV